MLTRKHFILIAQAIALIEDKKLRKEMAEHNAKIAARSNPRFDRARFFAACNVNG